MPLFRRLSVEKGFWDTVERGSHVSRQNVETLHTHAHSHSHMFRGVESCLAASRDSRKGQNEDGREEGGRLVRGVAGWMGLGNAAEGGRGSSPTAVYCILLLACTSWRNVPRALLQPVTNSVVLGW